MNRFDLNFIANAAFMAGQYKADREHYMSCARLENGQYRCVYVKSARKAHHQYMAFLSRALAFQS